MAVSALTVFRIVGSLIDDLLDIPDILSRLVTCKTSVNVPSVSATALQRVIGNREDGINYMVRELMERRFRPLTLALAEEVMAGVIDITWDCGCDIYMNKRTVARPNRRW
jgi:hypothetical protein